MTYSGFSQEIILRQLFTLSCAQFPRLKLFVFSSTFRIYFQSWQISVLVTLIFKLLWKDGTPFASKKAKKRKTWTVSNLKQFSKKEKRNRIQLIQLESRTSSSVTHKKSCQGLLSSEMAQNVMFKNIKWTKSSLLWQNYLLPLLKMMSERV